MYVVSIKGQARVRDQNMSLTMQIDFSPLDILINYCAVRMRDLQLVSPILNSNYYLLGKF